MPDFMEEILHYCLLVFHHTLVVHYYKFIVLFDYTCSNFIRTISDYMNLYDQWIKINIDIYTSMKCSCSLSSGCGAPSPFKNIVQIPLLPLEKPNQEIEES